MLRPSFLSLAFIWFALLGLTINGVAGTHPMSLGDVPPSLTDICSTTGATPDHPAPTTACQHCCVGQLPSLAILPAQTSVSPTQWVLAWTVMATVQSAPHNNTRYIPPARAPPIDRHAHDLC